MSESCNSLKRANSYGEVLVYVAPLPSWTQVQECMPDSCRNLVPQLAARALHAAVPIRQRVHALAAAELLASKLDIHSAKQVLMPRQTLKAVQLPASNNAPAKQFVAASFYAGERYAALAIAPALSSSTTFGIALVDIAFCTHQTADKTLSVQAQLFARDAWLDPQEHARRLSFGLAAELARRQASWSWEALRAECEPAAGTKRNKACPAYFEPHPSGLVVSAAEYQGQLICVAAKTGMQLRIVGE